MVWNEWSYKLTECTGHKLLPSYRKKTPLYQMTQHPADPQPDVADKNLTELHLNSSMVH